MSRVCVEDYAVLMFVVLGSVLNRESSFYLHSTLFPKSTEFGERTIAFRSGTIFNCVKVKIKVNCHCRKIKLLQNKTSSGLYLCICQLKVTL